MSWLVKSLSSSIGRKVLMALTGLFLCTFLIVHMVGNLQLFNDDGGYSFNAYAVFMTTNPLIKTVSYGLYAMILPTLCNECHATVYIYCMAII